MSFSISGKTVISVLGTDRPGIIARVSSTLAELNCNILDITQTVMRDAVFTMVMLVDIKDATAGFDEIHSRLDECARDLNMEINVQREEIFQAMHRI